MKSAPETPNVVEACNLEGRQERLDGLLSQLEMCEKALQVSSSNAESVCHSQVQGQVTALYCMSGRASKAQATRGMKSVPGSAESFIACVLQFCLRLTALLAPAAAVSSAVLGHCNM